LKRNTSNTSIVKNGQDRWIINSILIVSQCSHR
jgi:hypothetical protein